LEHLDLQPLILHEQAGRGRTFIEKFEAQSDVGYAVVMITGDDVGHVASKPEEARPRARQNVILELGYFLGKLGRDKVSVLVRGDVEIPSDFLGVEYIAMDSGGAWRFTLGGEISAAQIDVDLNALKRS
jgi:predicted nucleotide-binding protein